MGTELYINLSLVLVGLVPLLFGLWQLKRGLSNRSWSMVEGTITKLRITKGGTKSQGFHTHISYEYWVGPDRHVSENINEGNFSSGFEDSAQNMAQQYSPGKKVKVFYNPRHPEQSVLETGPTFGTFAWLAIGCLFTFLPLISIVRSVLHN